MGSGLVERATTSSQDGDKDDPLVAICGAGIGGCALALALQQRNIRCVVFEKDPCEDARSQGYGLTLQQGSKAARRLGILDECVDRASVRYCDRWTGPIHRSFDASGNLLGSFGGGGDGGGRNHRMNLIIARRTLRQILLGRLKPGTVKWGRTLRQVEIDRNAAANEGKSLGLFFDNENGVARSRINASVLVGADGIRSTVRKLCFQPGTGFSTRLQSMDTMVLLGITDRSPSPEHPLSGGDIFETVDGQTRFYAMPYSSGVAAQDMWQLSFPLAENEAISLSRAGPPELLKEALRRCSFWHDPIPDMIRTTPNSLTTGYPIYDLDDPLTPELSREESVALLGDAAHPMAPFKGQGANQALLDALSLAEALYDSQLGDSAFARRWQQEDVERRYGPRSKCMVPTALRAYGMEMAARSSVKMRRSREASALLHSPEALVPRNETRAEAARGGWLL